MKLKSEIKDGERYFWIEGFKEYALPEIIILNSRGGITYIPIKYTIYENVRDKEIREKKLIIKEYFKKFPEALA
jgi:hypothetical protein